MLRSSSPPPQCHGLTCGFLSSSITTEAAPAIRGPRTPVGGHANLPCLLCLAVEGRQKGFCAASALAQHHRVTPCNDQQGERFGTVHTFISVVASRELTSISSRMQGAAMPLSSARGSEEQPGQKRATVHTAKLRETAAVAAGRPSSTNVQTTRKADKEPRLLRT